MLSIDTLMGIICTEAREPTCRWCHVTPSNARGVCSNGLDHDYSTASERMRAPDAETAEGDGNG